MVLPFSGKPWLDRLMAAHGNEVASVPAAVNALVAEGGTDIYACAQALVERLAAAGSPHARPGGGADDRRGAPRATRNCSPPIWREAGQGIPVFADHLRRRRPAAARGAGPADARARVFDGRKDLAAAFRTARGYN